MIPVQLIAVALGLGLARRLPAVYHRICCAILGFKISLHGERSRARPTLFVCNHTSYLDITILGALIEGSFIAKSEVSGWPLFGVLAKLQRTVFIDRRAAKADEHRDEIRNRLDAGDDLILFPEGTSADGNRVRRFKSALFSVAERSLSSGRPLMVQPVSVSYTRLDGMPIGRALRPYFAWYGEMGLMSHIWAALGLGTVTVTVQFHPAVQASNLGSRKMLAEHCHRVVAAGVSAANSGRMLVPPVQQAA